MNLDRFAGVPIEDPAEARVVATCAHCGGGIYAGEPFYMVDDYISLHLTCIPKYIASNWRKYVDAEEVCLA